MRALRSRPGVRPRPTRAGLAPLEFVAALPILILLAALMVVVGGAGIVTTRGEINARYAGWRTLGVRAGGGNPNPRNWEAPASLSVGGGAPKTQVDGDWDRPELDALAVRRDVQSVRIDRDARLEMSEGVAGGRAQYRRPIPLLSKVFAKRTYDVDLTQDVYDDEWRWGGPAINPDIGRNPPRPPSYAPEIDTRGHAWYDFEEYTIFNEMDGPRGQLVNAGLSDLDPLDRDQELAAEYGFPPRDFHPRFRGVQLSDAAVLRGHPRFQLHEQAIAKVPGTMARAFIQMYQRQKGALAMGDPNDPGIAVLDQKIAQMNDFLDQLPAKHK